MVLNWYRKNKGNQEVWRYFFVYPIPGSKTVHTSPPMILVKHNLIGAPCRVGTRIINPYVLYAQTHNRLGIGSYDENGTFYPIGKRHDLSIVGGLKVAKSFSEYVRAFEKNPDTENPTFEEKVRDMLNQHGLYNSHIDQIIKQMKRDHAVKWTEPVSNHSRQILDDLWDFAKTTAIEFLGKDAWLKPLFLLPNPPAYGNRDLEDFINGAVADIMIRTPKTKRREQ